MLTKNRLTLVKLLPVLLLLSSCAGPKLNPSSSDDQSILVLPVVVENSSGTGKHSFYYEYEIKHSAGEVDPYTATIKLPIKGDMLIVDALPPGDYYLDKFVFLPVGSGEFDFSNNVEKRYDRISLKPRSITIFSQSLKIEMTKGDLGGGLITNYRMGLVPVTDAQEREIRASLEALPNIESWTIAE